MRLPVDKPVADAAHRQDVTGMGRFWFDFLPQLSDVNVHHTIDHHGFAQGIEPVQQFVAGKIPTGGGHEGLEQGILVRCEGDRPPFDPEPALFKIQLHIGV
jgi:hypothetical protein